MKKEAFFRWKVEVNLLVDSNFIMESTRKRLAEAEHKMKSIAHLIQGFNFEFVPIEGRGLSTAAIIHMQEQSGQP